MAFVAMLEIPLLEHPWMLFVSSHPDVLGEDHVYCAILYVDL